MKTITRRLARLEQQFVPREDPKVRRAVELLRERRRRRMEANGQKYEEPPPVRYEESTEPRSIADVFRAARL